MSDASKPSLEDLAQRFEEFGTIQADTSPLYTRLALGVAGDPEILALAAHCPPGQPDAILLFAAVQFLLLQGESSPLAAFYPTLSAVPPPVEDPYPLFRAFCLDYWEPIRYLLKTRRVQTNEVRRCACLLPAFAYVAEQTPNRPLAMIEIGTSAGLNLLWDRYGYDYGEGRRCGDLASPVQLDCALRGDRIPPLPAELPAVAFRAGIDIRPIDLRDEAAILWLRALIWPEHRDRVERLQAAVQVARRNPPLLIAGDALDVLPSLLPTVPQDTTLCLYHSYTLNQFPREARERLNALLKAHSAQRPIYRLSIEGKRDSHIHVELMTYREGQSVEQLLAYNEAHGRWLEWRL